MNKKLILGMALAASTALLSPAFAARDTLTIGQSQFPSNWHPLIDAMVAKSYPQQMTIRALTTYDADWNNICLMCTELPTLENGLAKLTKLEDGSDAIEITFKLKPELKWGDGTPVTAHDAKFTWEIGRSGKVAVGNPEAYQEIHKFEVTDDHTFVATVSPVSYQYNSWADFVILPKHIEEAAYAEPEKYEERSAFNTDPTNPGLYWGPYRVTEFVANSHVALEPNPTWAGKQPHFKKITVRLIDNTAALEQALLAGDIDYVAGELGFTLDQGLELEKRHADKFDFVYEPGLIYEHIDANYANPLLQDKRVRQAMMYAIDRQTLVDKLFQGKQPVAQTQTHPMDAPFAEVQQYGFDPAKAKALLEEAGWTMGPDGVRVNAAGERLVLNFGTTAGNATRELVQQVLQSQWGDVGIKVDIVNKPPREFFGETTRKRDFDLAMFAWISSPENLPETTLSSGSIPTPENDWAGQNYTGYTNPEMDELLEKIKVTLNFEERLPLWKRLQEIYAEDLPALPLYYRANPYVFPKWLKGVEPTGHQFSSSNWVEDWYAE